MTLYFAYFDDDDDDDDDDEMVVDREILLPKQPFFKSELFHSAK